MAIILVLGLISITLAVSYAMIRTQTGLVQSQVGGGLRAEARQAAYTALSAAMQRMNQSAWSGTETAFTGTLGPTTSFAAEYVTGDLLLTTTDAQAGDWPYRVTITATGYASDPAATSVVTTCKLEGVVQLIPRQRATNPSAWTTMSSHVVYQTNTDDCSFELPLQIAGSVRLQGGMTLCSEYPSPTSCRNEYLSDLNEMRGAGSADCRPFTGPITLPFNETTGAMRNLLTNNLGVTLTNASGSAVSNWSHPGNVSTYRLYPGGKTYSAVALGANVSNTTLAADPRTNPAGLFVRNGDVAIGGNTTIDGTLISTADVQFSGSNISITPRLMPALDGTTVGARLPAVVAGDDVYVNAGSSSTVRGVVAVFDDFSCSAGTQATRLDLQGRLLARQILFGSRSEWDHGSFIWSIYWALFNDLLIPEYLPAYMQRVWNMQYSPQLTIAAWNDPATSQWFNSSSPLYSVPSADSGLRWTLLRVRELP